MGGRVYPENLSLLSRGKVLKFFRDIIFDQIIESHFQTSVLGIQKSKKIMSSKNFVTFPLGIGLKISGYTPRTLESIS